jgi:tetratricopeptide (TPR) repeat protein
VFAADSWQQFKKLGQVSDAGAEYEKAADYYARALKLVPPQDASQVAEVEALLAADYVHQTKFAQAAPLVKHILDTVPRLKATNRLDPEVLVNVKFLSEGYETASNSHVSMEERKKLFNQFDQVSLSLGDLVAPNDDEIYARRYSRARGYIYFGEPDRADKALAQLITKMKPSSRLYIPVQLAEAAVQSTMHKPQMMDKLSTELSKKDSEITVLRQVAQAHLWAANYAETDKTLGKALAILATEKPPDANAELEIHRIFLNSYDDRNLWSKSEVHARRILELIASTKGKKSDEYNKAASKLVFYLKKDNKLAEAKAFEKKVPNDLNWLIEDMKANP